MSSRVAPRRLVRPSRLWPAVFGLCAIGLAGCDYVTDPYARPGIWRPNGSNEANFQLQVAHPSDLLAGRGTTDSDGESAAAAIDRLRRDKVKPLPSSTISNVGAPPAAGAGS